MSSDQTTQPAEHTHPLYGPMSADELHEVLNEDLDILRVLFVLSTGFHWSWAVPELADPGAVQQAIERGYILEPPDPRMTYHLTDPGARKIHNWIRAITPVAQQDRFQPLWFHVTRSA